MASDIMKRLATPLRRGGIIDPTMERAVNAAVQRGRLAMEHVGMDLGKRESQIAIVTEDGELVEKRIRTDRTRLREFFGARPKARILLEAATESEWVARCLEALGHEVRSRR